LTIGAVNSATLFFTIPDLAGCMEDVKKSHEKGIISSGKDECQMPDLPSTFIKIK
jgi:hypothetical protein